MIISLRIKGNHLRDDVFTLVTLFLSILRSNGLVWDGVVKKRDYLIGLYPSKTCKSWRTAIHYGKQRSIDSCQLFFYIPPKSYGHSCCYCSGNFCNHCSSVFWKYVSDYLSDDNRKGKYQMSLNFRYLFRSWSKFQHIDVSLSISSEVESNHLIFK